LFGFELLVVVDVLVVCCCYGGEGFGVGDCFDLFVGVECYFVYFDFV